MQIRLADKAYAEIVAMIDDRNLEVGDRLPAESQLCDKLGVSRTVIREALTRLASDGITESRRGAGSFVTRLPSRLLNQHMPASEMSTTLGSYEVRFALEAEAARLAALRRSTEEMNEIEARLNDLVKALRSNGDGDVEDMQLQHIINLDRRAASGTFGVTVNRLQYFGERSFHAIPLRRAVPRII